MKVTALYRHPIKGLLAERVDTLSLVSSYGCELDRRFAIAHGASAFDPNDPVWLKRRNFLNLAHCPKLACLTTRYDAHQQLLVIEKDGAQIYSGQFVTGPVDSTLSAILEEHVAPEYAGPYRIARLPNQPLTDASFPSVSILFEASLHELERQLDQRIDKERFRANIWIADSAPWTELDSVGKIFDIGQVRIKVIEPIVRCAAIDTYPRSGARDLKLLECLQKTLSRVHFGVRAQVLSDGAASVGDRYALRESN